MCIRGRLKVSLLSNKSKSKTNNVFNSVLACVCFLLLILFESELHWKISFHKKKEQ